MVQYGGISSPPSTDAKVIVYFIFSYTDKELVASNHLTPSTRSLWQSYALCKFRNH